MIIARCTAKDCEEWAKLRHALWPDQALRDLRREAESCLDRPNDTIALLARTDNGAAVGFAEANLRRDYVNGCEISPVVFLEGIYVDPRWRRRGLARQLVEQIEQWGTALGCTEFASDALLSNEASHTMHQALGFAETERVVYFRKVLPRG